MESKSLAVQYRPSTLGEVVGQDSAVAVLEGMFKAKRFPSSILISGHTGCGKTTLAQIFATRVNCQTGNQCGKCPSCKLSQRHPDIVFHNAGTDGKIEDIRKLVQAAKVAPSFRKRIIIIDECHKLTGASAEALLVPMESAPKNTIWILCTTNPEKLTGTIVNRCTRLNLKPVEHDVIVARLLEIVEAEGLKKLKGKSGKNALNMIASISNGSMRDAVSHLEALKFALESGRDFSSENALVSFLSDGEVDIERAAVDMVANTLQLNLAGAVASIRKANNARGLVSKARWLVDYLIGVKTKTAKFVPYAGRLLSSEYPEVKSNLSVLIALQSRITEAELRMNSCAIDENVLLTTSIGDLILEYK